MPPTPEARREGNGEVGFDPWTKSAIVQNFFQQGCAWQRYCTNSFMALQKWHDAKHVSAGLIENPQNGVHSKDTAQVSF